MKYIDQLVYGGTLTGLSPIALEKGTMLNKVPDELVLAIINSINECVSIQELCVVLKCLDESSINICERGGKVYSTGKMYTQITGAIVSCFAVDKYSRAPLIGATALCITKAFDIRATVNTLLLKL